MAKILIVEDEESIAELEKDYLESEGYEVAIEVDAKKGLARAISEDFDLYILDIMLPGGDGLNICSEIRKVKNAPIIMVSAKKEDDDKVKGLSIGADDYVTKPFSPSELVARVKAHLDRYDRLTSGSAPGDVIEIQDLKIDKSSRRVFVGKKEKVLTSKEFDLLAFLAAHPGRVFSKDDLFKEIWGMDSYGEIATVTVHIKKIREKIERDTGNPKYIETIWGVGYRFKG